MRKYQNKSAFTIVETLVAVTIVTIAMSLLLGAISQSSLIYNHILSKQNSIQQSLLLILSSKNSGKITLSDEVDSAQLPFNISGQTEQKTTMMSLQNSSGMFLKLEKSTFILDNKEKVEFIRLGKF